MNKQFYNYLRKNNTLFVCYKNTISIDHQIEILKQIIAACQYTNALLSSKWSGCFVSS